MAALSVTQQLLVEGKNDQHVIWALCEKHQIPETFSVELPTELEGGIDELLESIPVRLKMSRLQALGIIVDADQNLQSRWTAVCQRLAQAGYKDLPLQPEHDGTIIAATGKPRVGIWLMPDNQIPGMLENFVAHLIPDNDLLALKAKATLQEIEGDNLHGYSLTHHAKAFIHTWLAWQVIPGQPMGLAITANVLQYNKPLAAIFIQWLNRLFL